MLAQQRHLLATLAKQTPGVYYYSADIGAAYGADKDDVKNALGLLCAGANKFLDPRHIMTASFSGLSKSDEETGDWEASIRRTQKDLLEPSTQTGPDVSGEALRAWISEAVNDTPNTFYLDSNLFADFPDKVLPDGNHLSILQQAAMFLCNLAAKMGLPEATFTASFVMIDTLDSGTVSITTTKR